MTPSRQWSRRNLLALGAAASVASLAGCTSENATSSATGAASGATTGAEQLSPTGSGSASGSSPAKATPTRRVGGSAVEISRGPSTTNAVALTFHGAGDTALATSLLREIERTNSVATVFAVGSWLQTYPQMAKRIVDGGHLLGNHTMHHKPMRRLTSAQSLDEIAQGAAVVQRLTGSTGWFRPSGTPHATPTILSAAGRVGYRTSVSFDVDPADYSDPGEKLVVSRVLAGVRAGSIISLHLGHVGTLAAMPAILDGLTQRTLTAVTVATLLPGVTA